MAKLAQAYIYLRPFEVSEPRLIGFARATEATAAEVAQRVYDVEISIDVDLEAGSLKARITVIGSIAVFLYAGIADYKGFKESIGELCKDAREYAYDVCGGVLRLTGASEKEMVKTEKRTMTPGRASRVIDRLEKLEATRSTLNERQRHQEVQKILRALKAIEKDLTSDEVALLDKALQHNKEYRNLPPWQKPQSQLPDLPAEMPRVGITVESAAAPAKRLRYRNRIVVRQKP